MKVLEKVKTPGLFCGPLSLLQEPPRGSGVPSRDQEHTDGANAPGRLLNIFNILPVFLSASPDKLSRGYVEHSHGNFHCQISDYLLQTQPSKCLCRMNKQQQALLQLGKGENCPALLQSDTTTQRKLSFSWYSNLHCWENFLLRLGLMYTCHGSRNCWTHKKK